MAFGIMFAPANLGLLGLVFILGGVQVAIEETLEDSLCAELVEPTLHGMAFGVLATVNGVGDFLSSIIVGLLWSAFGSTLAFGYSALMFILGTMLVVRIPPPCLPQDRNISNFEIDRRASRTIFSVWCGDPW